MLLAPPMVRVFVEPKLHVVVTFPLPDSDATVNAQLPPLYPFTSQVPLLLTAQVGASWLPSRAYFKPAPLSMTTLPGARVFTNAPVQSALILPA